MRKLARRTGVSVEKCAMFINAAYQIEYYKDGTEDHILEWLGVVVSAPTLQEAKQKLRKEFNP